MKYSNSSAAVSRALNILELLAVNQAGLTNSQISRTAGLPKSSASYILRTLEERGYVHRGDERGLYRLGLRVLGLNRGVWGADVRELARPILRSLMERAQLTVFMAIRENDRAVYVAREEAPGPIKIDIWVGRRFPIHATSAGKSLVSRLSEAGLELLLGAQSLERHTPRTITSLPALCHELKKVREQGYAVEDEEDTQGVRCVSAPVTDAVGEVVSALGVAGTTNQISRSILPILAGHVRGAARQLSAQIG